MAGRGVLVCTLGGSWLVVPEILGYLDPGRFRVFPPSWWEGRPDPPVPPPAEVWVVATLGKPDGIRSLRAYWRGRGLPEGGLRILAPEGMDDVATPVDNHRMAELIHRLVLAARDRGGPVVCSLAGGRKTMSTLLQQAAAAFGADRVFHVVSSEGAIRDLDPEAVARDGLPEGIARDIHPVDLGEVEGFEGVEWEVHNLRALRARDFPVQGVFRADPGVEEVHLAPPWLYNEVSKRRAEAERIAGNYFFEILREDARDNFRSLYRLKPSRIRELRETRIGADPAREAADLAWLRRLPKADLHCHLGGVARPGELAEIAGAVASEAGPDFAAAREAVRSAVAWLQETSPGPGTLAEGRRRVRDATAPDPGGAPRHWRTAALIQALGGLPEWLDALTDPVRLQAWAGLPPIRAYFAAGDLQGSALLQSRAAIEATCRVLVRKAARDNVRYLEVRCSPVKYTREGLSEVQVLDAIRGSLRRAVDTLAAGRLHVELILIGTRHDRPEDLGRHVALAAESARGADPPRVVGFDLAGDESTKNPSEVRDVFMPLFMQCMKITIHAGETEPVERVWEAVYHLNADRIGHGLRLLDHPELLARFRDRGTAVEMCPTSNDQVVGFRDFWRDDPPDRRPYPLGRYLEEGVRVCVCTDNPGISRTTWSQELLKAARMTPGGLSRWDVLALVRGGFQAAFLGLPERARLLREADQAVYDAVAGMP